MTIENTKDRDPMLHLLGSMSDGPSGYIEGMESAGQRQLVQSRSLPTESPWDDLIALGFTRGDPVSGDPMFTDCTLPDGWGKEATDHAMWSDIHDERGIKRVAVFYKAAFYDRHAHSYIVDPGREASTHVIYGDDPVTLPAKWDLFTEAERASFVESLTREIADDKDFASQYGDSDGRKANYIKRAETALKLAA